MPLRGRRKRAGHRRSSVPAASPVAEAPNSRSWASTSCCWNVFIAESGRTEDSNTQTPLWQVCRRLRRQTADFSGRLVSKPRLETSRWGSRRDFCAGCAWFSLCRLWLKSPCHVEIPARIPGWPSSLCSSSRRPPAAQPRPRPSSSRSATPTAACCPAACRRHQPGERHRPHGHPQRPGRARRPAAAGRRLHAHRRARRLQDRVIRDIRLQAALQGRHHRRRSRRAPSPSTSSSPPTRRRCGSATAPWGRSSTSDAGDAAGDRARRAAVDDARRPAWRRRRRDRGSRRRATSASTAAARARRPTTSCSTGVDNNDLFLNRLVVNPSLDAIQEVSLLQNTYDAEHGRSAGAQVNMVLKSGTRNLHGSPTSSSATRRSTRATRSSPRQPRPKLRQAPVRRHDRRPDRPPRRSTSSTRRPSTAREADTRLAHVPTAAERAGDFSASGRPIRDPVHRTAVPRQRHSGVAHQRRRAAPPSPLSAAEPHRPAGQLRLVAARRRDAVQFTIKTDHHGWRDKPLIPVRYSFSRDDRDCRSRRAPQPARLRRLGARPGAQRRRRPDAGVSARACSTSSASASTRCTARTCRRAPAPIGFAALGITGRRSTASIGGIPAVVSRLRDARRRSQPAGRAPHAHRARLRQPDDRARPHHVKMGGELRHYDSDGYNHLFARGQATFTGRVHRASGPRSAARLPDDHAARRQRQPSGAAHVVGEPVRAGRLAHVAAADGERRRALRVQHAAVDADDRMRIFDPATLQLQQVGQDGVSRSGLTDRSQQRRAAGRR